MYKRKLIIVVIILLSMMLMACSSEQSKDDEADIEEVSASFEASLFKSEEELVNTVKSYRKSLQESDDDINEIDFYFRLKNLPKGAYLQKIEVKSFYVTMYYTFDDEVDPEWERKIILTWNRTLTGEEGISDILGRLTAEYKSVEVDSRKYVYQDVLRNEKDEKGQDIEGKVRIISRMVYWSQDGYSFGTVVPVWYSEEEMLEILQVEKVNIE